MAGFNADRRAFVFILWGVVGLGLSGAPSALAQRNVQPGAGGPPRSVEGTLAAISPQSVTVETNDGERLTIACLPRAVQGPGGRWYSTTYSVSAQGTPDLLTPGTIVVVRGEFDWSDFYRIKEPRLTVYVGGSVSERELEGEINPDGSIRMTGLVVSTNPLVVRHNNNGIVAITRSVNGKLIGPFAVAGAKFQVEVQPQQRVELKFGQQLQFAGEKPRVTVSLHSGINAADRIEITRRDEITPADLKSRPSQKRNQKRAIRKKP